MFSFLASSKDMWSEQQHKCVPLVVAVPAMLTCCTIGQSKPCILRAKGQLPHGEFYGEAFDVYLTVTIVFEMH